MTLGFYLTCLAILYIIQGFVVLTQWTTAERWLQENYGNSIFLSKLIQSDYITTTLPYLPAWLLTVIAVERTVSIVSIKMLNILKQRHVQIIILIVPLSLLFLVNINLIIVFDTPAAEEYNLQHSFIINFLFLAILPFTIMTTANIITGIKLMKSKSKFKTKVHKGGQNREIRFFATSLALNFGFFVFHAPELIFYLLSHIWVYVYNSNAITDQTDYLYTFLYFMISRLFYYFRCLYYLFQIFFYLAFNSVYRATFIRIFRLDKFLVVLKNITNRNNK